MTLSRKHFVKLAELLKKHSAKHETVTDFCDWLKTTNKAFDRNRFIKACGL
jgi:hypothetical protein